MIFSKDCYLKADCYRCNVAKKECEPFCQKLFKIDALLTNANTNKPTLPNEDLLKEMNEARRTNRMAERDVRDWLYVLDHCKAVDLIFHKGVSGETYNIGGHNERNNITIVNTICSILDKECPRKDGGKYADLITFVQDRAGHDLRYAIDATKLTTELGWKADETFDTGIIKTVEWYLNKYRV